MVVRSGVAGGGDGEARWRVAVTVESGVGAWRLDGEAEKGSEERKGLWRRWRGPFGGRIGVKRKI